MTRDPLNETACRYAFYFLTNQGIPEHGGHVRHFALHTLENTISARWNKMPNEQRESYRQASMSLMVSGSGEVKRWKKQKTKISVPCCSRVVLIPLIQLRGTKSIHEEALYVKVVSRTPLVLLPCLFQAMRHHFPHLLIPMVPSFPFFVASIAGESCCAGS